MLISNGSASSDTEVSPDGEPRKNRAPGGIGERGESRVEVLGRCELLNHSVK